MDNQDTHTSVAIVGMAARFPGAKDINQFWQNLCDGVESVTFFSDDELAASGVEPALLRNPNYVKARAILDDADKFDASFFGYTPRDAEIMDPQQRLFLECAWSGLEDAGHNPQTFSGRIGVYAGMGQNKYLLRNLYPNQNLIRSMGNYQIAIGNDKDFVSTRVAYKLNLKGPAISVNTACSTSLVAVHLARHSLLSYQCDMALAGGVRIRVPQIEGYLYQEGGILSPDGRCRAFDAHANGTVQGNGAGVVVLKRLADALADGDHIYAVIRGSAINNDGALKVGYTAPGIDGQAEVIAEAQAGAGVHPETISYVEAHGTGTTLGDPIEIAALAQAFGARTAKKGFCALGSVKTNIGHLDAAAGVAGLIKTALALKHNVLPPSLHFQQPNPRLNLAGTPFYVNTTLQPWPDGHTPRRAGISSFGIGGTNAHVVLEEAPLPEPSGPGRAWHPVIISAKTGPALDASTENLVGHLKQHPHLNMADAAYTLQVGRQPFSHRRLVVAKNRQDAIDALQAPDARRVFTAQPQTDECPVVFMFPGGGAQHVNMGRTLYQTEPLFKEQIDRCAAMLAPKLGFDLLGVLYPEHVDTQAAGQQLRQPSVGLPALFMVEYALAQLWMAWGVRPQALVGHSLGEYAAACLAGVFSLEDALSLVAARGKLFEQVPGGGMLAVFLPEEQVRPLLSDELSVAAVNGPNQCVVAGPAQAIDGLAGLLAQKEVDFKRVNIDVAAHSSVIDPILGEFTAQVEKLNLQPPRIPFISNVSGTWITAGQATDPHYWATHLRQTVRFAGGVQTLLQDSNRLLLEVGPGQTLSNLARQQPQAAGRIILPSMPHPQDTQPGDELLLATLGRLWLAGAPINWAGFHTGQRRHRLPLPTYPFERQRYWVEPTTSTEAAEPEVSAEKRPNIDDWFYIPSWRQTMPPQPVAPETLLDRPRTWLVFADELGLGAELAAWLKQAGQPVVVVQAGSQFDRLAGDTYRLNPQHRDDYLALMQNLRARNRLPQSVLHCWSITPGKAPPASFEKMQETGYYSLLFLVQALDKEGVISAAQADNTLQIAVVSNGLHPVFGQEDFYPEKATMLGPCKVIPQEYQGVTCRAIDVIETAPARRLVPQLAAEIAGSALDPVVAYRGNQRWVQHFERVSLPTTAEPARPLRKQGVYLITGGLGRVGLILAEHLAQTAQAKLVLLGRSPFPGRDTWEQRLQPKAAADPTDEELCRKIRQVQALEKLGAEVLILNADVSDRGQMETAIDEIYRRFGTLNGVIHAAGITTGKSLPCALNETGPEESAQQFGPKVLGAYVLAELLRDKAVDFCLLLSSNASILGGLELAAYSAANLFMDAFAFKHNAFFSTNWISSNWDRWLVTENQTGPMKTSLDRYSMTPQESSQAFERIVTLVTTSQVIVSTGNLQARLDQWVNLKPVKETEPASRVLSRKLQNSYVAPRNKMEQIIADIWQELLGIEPVGVHDNFFELGGHSLLATQFISRVRDIFQVKLPLQSIFDTTTVAEFARVTEEKLIEHLEQLSEEEAQSLLKDIT